MITYLFPGQGTQKAGMYQLLGDKSNEVQEVFDIVKEVTGRDIKQLCTEATDEELRLTINTQLCVTAMNMAYYQMLKNRGIQPDVVAGHSLGQFSALAAAGVLTLPDLFRLIQKRAQLMDELEQAGSLATSIGLDKQTVEAVCKEVNATGARVDLALENSNVQYVVGGTEEDVAIAVEKLKEAGAMRVVQIKVSNAFHTYMMEPMVKPFEAAVNAIEFHEPTARILLNAKGDFATSIDEIKEDVIRQCVSVVRWRESLDLILPEPGLIMAEVGVGKVMASTVKGMDRSKKVYLMSNEKDFGQFIELVK